MNRVHRHSRRVRLHQPVRIAAVIAFLSCSAVRAEQGTIAPGEVADSRIREIGYEADRIYRLEAYAGYQIDLEFEPGESFVGLGAGDIEGVGFVAQDNHLFLKPRAVRVHTNLVVLTSRRAYHFEYEASAERPAAGSRSVIYTLRFRYPKPAASGQASAQVPEPPVRNVDYWYCGDPAIRPVGASDDGLRTRLRFAAARELPAVFVHNGDGSESLVNFSVEEGDVIVHRVGSELLLRRGKLVGRVINQGFKAIDQSLNSGTISPQVQRVLREERP